MSARGGARPRTSAASPPQRQRAIVGESQFVTRPGYVTKGRSIPVDTNHFKINIRDISTVVYHYDVDISGLRSARDKNKQTNIDNWIAFQFYGQNAPNEERFIEFLDSLREMAQSQGIQMNEPRLVDTLNFSEGEQRLRTVLSQIKPQFLLFVQPNNEVFRGIIKDMCRNGRRVTVKSQFISTSEYENANDALKSKILRKLTGEKELSKKLNRRVIDTLVEQERGAGGLFRAADGTPILPAFDGQKNLFTSKPLNEIGTDPDVVATRLVRIQNHEIKEGNSEHTVTIKITGDFEADTEVSWQLIADYYNGELEEFPKKVVSVLNTIMRSGPLRNKFEVGANSMYAHNAQRKDLGRGVGYAFGHFQSVRPVAAGPSIVVDRTATAFAHNVSAMEFIAMLIERRDRPASPQDLVNLMRRENSNQRTEVEKELRKLQFCTRYTGKIIVKKKFFALSTAPANVLEFPTDNGPVKVADYFRNQYNIQLKYPQLFCMDFGDSNHHVYIPVELCKLVEDQHIRGTLRPEQNREFIKATAIPPERRFADIDRAAAEVVSDSRKYLAEFNIDMDLTPITTNGKVINPPSLVYGDGKIVNPRDGAWDLRNIKLYLPTGLIKKWAAFLFYEPRFGSDPRKLEEFIRSLKDMCRKMGLELGDPFLAEALPIGNDGGRRLREVITQEQPHFILFLQAEDDLFRARVKHFCEVAKKNLNNNCGVFSQCILRRVYERTNPQTLANIVLKINAKCGGINHKLQTQPPPLRRPGVIIIGADVTHDVPVSVLERSLVESTGVDRFQASIASVVGTTDSDFFKYYTEVRVQSREREEMISDFGSMFVAIIKNYYVKNQKKLPQTIIYYRDGVSEGQFRIVLDSEIRQMEQAFGKISGIVNQKFNPKVTFIVAQKRHHTRFKPHNPNDGVGRHGNVPPGLVVDNDVVDARDFDFFLNSHAGIQGLNKPTHYYVLRDDNNFTPDDLTEMTYHLCHTYGKATRAVSIPSPVYYAHLAAERARQHISTYNANPNAPAGRQVLSYEERTKLFQRLFDTLNAQIQVGPRQKEFMYYL